MDSASALFLSAMYGVYYNADVDYGHILWTEFVESLKIRNRQTELSSHRFWSVMVLQAYTLNKIPFVVVPDETMEILQFSIPSKIIGLPSDKFCGRVPDSILKVITNPHQNAVLQSYLRAVGISSGPLFSSTPIISSTSPVAPLKVTKKRKTHGTPKVKSSTSTSDQVQDYHVKLRSKKPVKASSQTTVNKMLLDLGLQEDYTELVDEDDDSDDGGLITRRKRLKKQQPLVDDGEDTLSDNGAEMIETDTNVVVEQTQHTDEVENVDQIQSGPGVTANVPTGVGDDGNDQRMISGEDLVTNMGDDILVEEGANEDQTVTTPVSTSLQTDSTIFTPLSPLDVVMPISPAVTVPTTSTIVSTSTHEPATIILFDPTSDKLGSICMLNLLNLFLRMRKIELSLCLVLLILMILQMMSLGIMNLFLLKNIKS